MEEFQNRIVIQYLSTIDSSLDIASLSGHVVWCALEQVYIPWDKRDIRTKKNLIQCKMVGEW